VLIEQLHGQTGKRSFDSSWVGSSQPAAVMVPQVLSIIQVTFPERERPAALGAYRVAPAEQDILVRGFLRCFDARFATTDITATPAACQARQYDPAVASVIADASRQATAGNFGSAITGSLWFPVGAFGLTALLLLLLPSRRVRSLP